MIGAAVITAFTVNSVLAQSTFGTFVGTVKDPTGSVVAECVITLTNTGTSTRRSTVTDKDGNYVLVNVSNFQIRTVVRVQ